MKTSKLKSKSTYFVWVKICQIEFPVPFFHLEKLKTAIELIRDFLELKTAHSSKLSFPWSFLFMFSTIIEINHWILAFLSNPHREILPLFENPGLFVDWRTPLKSIWLMLFMLLGNHSFLGMLHLRKNREFCHWKAKRHFRLSFLKFESLKGMKWRIWPHLLVLRKLKVKDEIVFWIFWIEKNLFDKGWELWMGFVR